MKNYKFTIVAVASNQKNFSETLGSILKSTSNLRDTQLIICDTDNICGNIVIPSETKVIDCTSLSEVQAFNKALPFVQGAYTTFAEDGVVFNKKAFSAVRKNIKKHPETHIVTSAETMTKAGDKKLYARFPMERKGTVDLSELPFYGHTALSTYTFFTNDIKGLEFDETIYDEGKKKFIIEALLRKPFVYVIEEHTCFYTNALENESNLNPFQYNKWYYTPSIENFIIPFMKELQTKEGRIPAFVQYIFTQLILAKYGNNHYENDKGVLSKDEAMEFHNSACTAFGFIDNAIFTEAAIRCKYVPRSMWALLLFEKCKKAGIPYELCLQDEKEIKADPSLKEEDRLLYLSAKGNRNARISSLKSIALTINLINYQDNMLEFDAEFTGKDFMDAKDIKIYAEYSGKKVLLEEYPIFSLLKCFGIPYTKKYSLHFFVPVDKNLKSIKFGCEICGEYQQLPLAFAGQFSRLRLSFGKAYWKFSEKLAMGVRNNNTLQIFGCTGFKHLKREIGLYLSMILHTKSPFFAMQCLALRTIYHLTRPFYKNRRIFLTFDKLYKAGDNGEYFWKYANTVKDDIETYYIVSDTSLDYKRLKEYDKKHTVVHNSLKCRLLALNAEAIVATHTMVMQYCGFPKYLHSHFLDHFNAKVICIQHGLTVQQLAQYQRRTYDNTTLYCLASKYEFKNLMHPVYGYEEDMLKLNGLARYDGLKNNDKKSILITPTWRRNIVSQGIAYKKKPYNELFKTTEYFRLYNELIHDEKLIETAKKNGYSITYLLHPAMSPQLEDFDLNGFVKVIAASGDMNYEEILTQSSLMVTDYSGVQFDFAYMRKPIVYYHPDTLPPHYESGGIDYPTQGFGPICTQHKELVDTICRFMENGCAPQQEYKDRADDFFEFDDFNNCQRIYDEILKFLEK